MTESVCNKRDEGWACCEAGLVSVNACSKKSERDGVSNKCEGRTDFVTISDEETHFDKRGIGRMLECLMLWEIAPERSGGDIINDDVTDIGEDPQMSAFEGVLVWEEAMLVKSPTNVVFRCC